MVRPMSDAPPPPERVAREGAYDFVEHEGLLDVVGNPHGRYDSLRLALLYAREWGKFKGLQVAVEGIPLDLC